MSIPDLYDRRQSQFRQLSSVVGIEPQFDVASPRVQDDNAMTSFALFDNEGEVDNNDEEWRMLPLHGLHGYTRMYIRTSNVSRNILNNPYFHYIVILAIGWASFAIGLQTYPSLSHNSIILDLEYVVLGIFILEAMIKINAEGLHPLNYFTGKEWRWNTFDFLIVITSLPVWGTALGHDVMILRLFRLVRIMKVVKQIPELYMIIKGLVAGVRSIGYILLLLFMVYYLYAIAGVLAWKNTDPFHFRNVPIAMVTLFRLSTLDNWMNVMTINYLGCDRFNGDYYSDDPADATGFQYCNTTAMFSAPMDQLPASEISYQRTVRSIVATLYFISFVLICAFVVLSLFIGAITNGMDYSMKEMRASHVRREEKQRLKRLHRREIALKHEERTSRLSLQSVHHEGSVSELSSAPSLHLRKRDLRKLQSLLLLVWHDKELTDHILEGSTGKRSLKSEYLKLAALSSRIVSTDIFQNFIIGIILLAGLVIGFQTSNEVEEQYGNILHGIDTFIIGVFTIEALMKIIAEGVQPWLYFWSGWNVFDFIIVVGSYVPSNGGFLTILRLLRLLRVLKLVRALPKLQIIVSALLTGVKSIGYISLIVVLCFYVYAILGNILFAENDPFHFGKLHFTMMTLLRCATTESWSDVLFINYYGCDIYGGLPYADLGYSCSPKATGWVAVVYFCTFEVVGGMVLISLFIGLVSTGMDQAALDQKEDQRLLSRVDTIRVQHGISKEDIRLFMEVFKILDMDNTGTLEEEELRIGLTAIGKNPSHEELRDLMNLVDTDKSGEIDLVEFLEFMVIQRAKSRYNNGWQQADSHC